MITLNAEKCVRCGICARDCFCAVITHREGELPVFNGDAFKHCIGCQHCLAICPQGAISCNGVSADQCLPLGRLPDAQTAMNFIRQRRSIRRYKEEPVPADQMEQLKDALRWMPTGCNDHRLFFAIVEDCASMDFFRDVTRRFVAKIARPWIIKFLPFPVARFLRRIVNGEDVIYYHAPHMIVCASPKHAPCKEADPWIALSYFDVLAHSFGFGTCWCGFAVYAFKLIPALRRKIQLPKGYRVTSVLLFGKPDVAFARSTVPAPTPVVSITG